MNKKSDNLLRMIRLVDRMALAVFVAEEEEKIYQSLPKDRQLGSPLTRRGIVFAPCVIEFNINAKRAICEAVEALTYTELNELTKHSESSESSSKKAYDLIAYNRALIGTNARQVGMCEAPGVGYSPKTFVPLDYSAIELRVAAGKYE